MYLFEEQQIHLVAKWLALVVAFLENMHCCHCSGALLAGLLSQVEGAQHLEQQQPSATNQKQRMMMLMTGGRWLLLQGKADEGNNGL